MTAFILAPDGAALITSLNTGDLLLFSGHSGTSESIKWMTISNFSHVGVVLREGAHLHLWESTTLDDIRDRATNTFHQGVQLVPLAERVSSYEGEIAARRLQGVTLSRDYLNRFAALRDELKGRPYETSTVEALKAAHDGPFGENQRNVTSLFCSELAAETYQALGVLDRELPSNEYIPADFSQRHEKLRLVRGRFGAEQALKIAV